MNTEIRYADESLPAETGAVRVLMQGGQWLVPEQGRPACWRKLEQPVECAEKPRDTPVVVRENPIKATPKEKRRGGGRGFAWRRNTSLTLDKILEWQREGLTLAQMAKRANCPVQTINTRMIEGRRTNPEYLAAYAALVVCPTCGGRKFASRKMCAPCTRAAKKRGGAA